MRLVLALILAVPLLAQEIVLLRPGSPPDPKAPPERVEERGKDGVTDRAVMNVREPSLTVYLPKIGGTGMAIVICPGGGYHHLAIDKEGHDVARWLNSIGVTGIVLKYRLPGSEKMLPAMADLSSARTAARVAIEDGEDAIRLVRSKASAWGIDPHRVGLMGFSAGGHLAAMVGMLAPPDARPDFLVLGYPALPKELSIDATTPQTFLVHAADDTTVPVTEHSVRWFVALRAAKVPAQLMVYSTGGHGFGIRQTANTASAWPAELAAWLKEWNRSR
jgi:acetyl esterase/lipase